jgi:hypothetical protein
MAAPQITRELTLIPDATLITRSIHSDSHFVAWFEMYRYFSR